MFIDRGGDSIKRDVKLVSLLKSEMTTTIAGSLGIDEIVLDWLCEEPTVSICAKKNATPERVALIKVLWPRNLFQSCPVALLVTGFDFSDCLGDA